MSDAGDPGEGTVTRRAFERLLRAPWVSLAVLLVLCAAAAVPAGRVRVDFSNEATFPERAPERLDYDRYKAEYPFEDARAIVCIRADDLFTPAGIERVRALERDLAAIDGVKETQGLATVKDVFARPIEGERDAALSLEPLFPEGLTADAFAARERIATTDPVFRYLLATPDGKAATIRIAIERDHASSDVARTRFLKALRGVLAEHAHPGQDLVASGMPVIRAEFNEMIERDMGTLLPIAVLTISLLIYLTFRTLGAVLAALLTIGAACLGLLAFMGAAGYPIQLMTQLTPIVVMIVSVSDTVHIVEHYHERLRAGRGHRDAIVDALVDSAYPCLVTEVVIAAGFLGLIGQDIRMIGEFGVVTAAGMLLAWVANVTALPLALWFLRPRSATADEPGRIVRLLTRMVEGIDGLTRRRGRTIAAVAVAVVGVAGVAAASVGREYYTFGNLRKDAPLLQRLRVVEALHGGTVPLAVHVEPPPRRVVLVGLDRARAEEADALLEGAPLRSVRTAIPTLAAALHHLDGVAETERPHLLVVDLGLALADGAAALERLATHPASASAQLAVLADRAAPPGVGERLLPFGIVGVERLDDEEGRAAFQRLVRAGEPMLEPEAVALLDRIAAAMEKELSLRQVQSVSKLLGKVHEMWVEGEADPAAPRRLPETRGQVAQEMLLLDAPALRDVLSHDRASAAVFALVPDMGSSRATELARSLQGILAREAEATGYRVTMTGQFMLSDAAYRLITGGLIRSLGVAVLISLLVFTLALRSWRLGLVAMVPNLLPLVLTAGLMRAFGIELEPVTVVVFSITLVIADDDTVQFLVRYRRRYEELRADLGPEEAHDAASSETLGATGIPMLLTAFTVSLGFLTFAFSQFLGLQKLGVLIGVSLFTAVFADLFLSPLILRTLKPRL